MEAKDSAKTDALDDEDKKAGLGLSSTRSTLEERRKSLLDHHWAIPSKDRLVFAQLPHACVHTFSRHFCLLIHFKMFFSLRKKCTFFV